MPLIELKKLCKSYPLGDMELKILIHGVNVVEDVSGNSRNDSHQLGVMQLSLGSKGKGIPNEAWAQEESDSSEGGRRTQR